jgi:hypothetical protein
MNRNMLANNRQKPSFKCRTTLTLSVVQPKVVVSVQTTKKRHGAAVKVHISVARLSNRAKIMYKNACSQRMPESKYISRSIALHVTTVVNA